MSKPAIAAVCLLLVVQGAAALQPPLVTDAEQRSTLGAIIRDFDDRAQAHVADHPALFPDGYTPPARAYDGADLLELEDAARSLAQVRFHVSLGVVHGSQHIDQPSKDIRAWMAHYHEATILDLQHLVQESHGHAPEPGVALEDQVRRAWPAYHILGNQEFQEAQFVKGAIRNIHDVRVLMAAYIDVESRRLLAHALAAPIDEEDNGLRLDDAASVHARADLPEASPDPDVRFAAKRAAASLDTGRAFDALMYTLVAQYGRTYSLHAEAAIREAKDPLPLVNRTYHASKALAPSMALHWADQMAYRALRLAEAGQTQPASLFLAGSEALAWYDLVALLRDRGPPAASAQQDADQESPGPAVLLLGAAGFCLAARARRRSSRPSLRGSVKAAD